jgi:hypothetical protein
MVSMKNVEQDVIGALVRTPPSHLSEFLAAQALTEKTIEFLVK